MLLYKLKFCFSRDHKYKLACVGITATGQRRLFLGLFFGGWQNIKKREVFAAARLDVGPFVFLLFIFYILVIILD